MVYHVYKKARFLQSLLPNEHQSATKLAFALALGLMLGLVPKDNLIAAAITIVILATTVHKPMAVLTAFVVGLGSGLADPLTHRIGYAILTHDALQGVWAYLYELPLIAWTDCNNTVVTGSFVLGLVLFYPAYRFSRPLFQKYWVRTKPVGNQPPVEPVVDAHESQLNAGGDQPVVAKQSATIEEADSCDCIPFPDGFTIDGPHGLPLRPMTEAGRHDDPFADTPSVLAAETDTQPTMPRIAATP